MASPESFDVRNVAGDYSVNAELSDDLDPMFRLWGTNWLMRLVLRYTKINARMETAVDDDGVVHVNLLHIATGGIKSTEFIPVNDQPIYTEDGVFGKVRRQAKFIRRKEITDDYLLGGWEDYDGELISKTGFKESGTATQQVHEIWGFQKINGTKYFVKKLLLRDKADEVKIRLVYNYDGDHKATHQTLQALLAKEAKEKGNI